VSVCFWVCVLFGWCVFACDFTACVFVGGVCVWCVICVNL